MCLFRGRLSVWNNYLPHHHLCQPKPMPSWTLSHLWRHAATHNYIFFNNNMQQIFITQLLGLSAFSNTNWFFVCFWYDTSFTHTHTQTHTSICKYVHACTPTLPDMPICVCMYVHVCMCTHTHTHTHTLSVCLSVSLSLCDKIPTSPPVFLKQRN